MRPRAMTGLVSPDTSPATMTLRRDADSEAYRKSPNDAVSNLNKQLKQWANHTDTEPQID